ncbi:hypothetical protein QBC35DRAFT_464629 [Podospora australis]|uniref:Uncharacterized protein n=1 Tax=Podospora australis TaxID=1536484 RepID=A0AAN6WSF0_9PEZI|nr:hypothetical protein QBC35DRAFT_464629 [Podospora australis]
MSSSSFTFRNPFNFFFPSSGSPRSSPQQPISPSFFTSSKFLSRGSYVVNDSDENMLPPTQNMAAAAGSSVSSPAETNIPSTFSSPASSCATADSDMSSVNGDGGCSNNSYFPPMMPTKACPDCSTAPSLLRSDSLSSSVTSSSSVGSSTDGVVAVGMRTKHKVDVMSAQYPKPKREPTLDELLARPPGKWSLGYYVKNARDVPVKPETDGEARRREMEEVKRQLLKDSEALRLRR